MKFEAKASQCCKRDARTFFELEVPALGQSAFDAEQAKKISPPTLMVRTPARIERKPFVRELFPEVDYRVVEGVIHGLQVEDPRAVPEAMADFIRRHPFEVTTDQ